MHLQFIKVRGDDVDFISDFILKKKTIFVKFLLTNLYTSDFDA